MARRPTTGRAARRGARRQPIVHNSAIVLDSSGAARAALRGTCWCCCPASAARRASCRSAAAVLIGRAEAGGMRGQRARLRHHHLPAVGRAPRAPANRGRAPAGVSRLQHARCSPRALTWRSTSRSQLSEGRAHALTCAQGPDQPAQCSARTSGAARTRLGPQFQTGSALLPRRAGQSRRLDGGRRRQSSGCASFHLRRPARLSRPRRTGHGRCATTVAAAACSACQRTGHAGNRTAGAGAHCMAGVR